nr:hypothetical protein [Tanacetum cinerariifolium]
MWNVLWTLLSSSRSSSLYATGPILSRILNGGILSIKARDMDMKLLSAPESNNSLARFLGQVTHLVASLTLDKARSCVMQVTSSAPGTVSNVPTIYSWGGSISSDNFLPSILLLMEIGVAVVIVVVVIVMVVIVGGESSPIIKLSFVIVGFEAVTFPSILQGNPLMKTSIIFSEFNTMVGHKTANSWNVLTKKSQGLNSDDGNTRGGSKKVGGALGAGGGIVILNGDSPTPTRVVDGVVHAIAPTTTEPRLAKKNESKVRGTLLIALPDKYQLKFNIHKDAKSQMEAIEKRNKTDLEDHSLDDLFKNLKIYEAEVKSSSSTSHNTQNIAFVSSQNTNSTNESVSVVPSIFTASTMAPASILPNVDHLSDVVIYYFFTNLKWQMAMLTMRVKRFLQRTKRNLGANGTTAIGFDMSKADEEPTNYALMAFTSSSSFSSLGSDSEVAPFSKACTKAYATLQSHYDKLIVDFRKSQFDVLSYKSGLESIEARIVAYQQNENVFKEDIKLLQLDVMLRDNALVELRKKFEKAKKERDELKITLEKFQTSSKNLRTFMPPKPNLVFHDAPTASKPVPNMFNIELSTTKPTKEMSQSNRPSAPIIEDWVSESEDESKGEPMPTQKEPILTRSRLVPLNAIKLVTITVPHPTVTSPRPVNHVVNKAHSLIRRPINHRPAHKHRNLHKTVTTIKVNKVNAVKGTKGNWGNPQQALKDKGVIDSGCSRHMTRNISYLFDFEEINRGYVAFGKNPQGGKITGKDMVPRKNNMYNVDLKNVVPSGDLTCLFAKATLDESNL